MRISMKRLEERSKNPISRLSGRILGFFLIFLGFLSPVSARDKESKEEPVRASSTKEALKAKKKEEGSPKTTAKSASDSSEPPKPVLVATFEDWGVYLTKGKDKTCYVLGQPSERKPSQLKRDPAYLFISTRPQESVRDEISVSMGFEVKITEKAKAVAKVGNESFEMISKGSNLWLKEAGQEGRFVQALKKGAKLTVEAASQKGNKTSDLYRLSGLNAALERLQKECR